MSKRQRPSTVGVRELRQNLSIHLDRVKRGEALTVTENGTPVAILRPLSLSSSVLDRLVAGGRATPPSTPGRGLPRPLALRLARPLSAILDDIRDERI